MENRHHNGRPAYTPTYNPQWSDNGRLRTRRPRQSEYNFRQSTKVSRGRGRPSHGRVLRNCSTPVAFRSTSSVEMSPCNLSMKEFDRPESCNPLREEDADVATAKEIIEDLKQRPPSVNIEGIPMEISDSSNSSCDIVLKEKTDKISETKEDSYFDKLYKTKSCSEMNGDGNINLNSINKMNTFLKNERSSEFLSKFNSKTELKSSDNGIKHNSSSHSTNEVLQRSDSHNEVAKTKCVSPCNEVKPQSDDKINGELRKNASKSIDVLPPVKCIKRRNSIKSSIYETKSKSPEPEILNKSKEEKATKRRSECSKVIANKKEKKDSNFNTKRRSSTERKDTKHSKHVSRRHSEAEFSYASRSKEEDSRKDIVGKNKPWRPRRINVITDSDSDGDVKDEIDYFIKENKAIFEFAPNEEKKRKPTVAVETEETNHSLKKKPKSADSKKNYFDVKLNKDLAIMLHRIDCDKLQKDLEQSRLSLKSSTEKLSKDEEGKTGNRMISTNDLLSTLTGEKEIDSEIYVTKLDNDLANERVMELLVLDDSMDVPEVLNEEILLENDTESITKESEEIESHNEKENRNGMDPQNELEQIQSVTMNLPEKDECKKRVSNSSGIKDKTTVKGSNKQENDQMGDGRNLPRKSEENSSFADVPKKCQNKTSVSNTSENEMENMTCIDKSLTNDEVKDMCNKDENKNSIVESLTRNREEKRSVTKISPCTNEDQNATEFLPNRNEKGNGKDSSSINGSPDKDKESNNNNFLKIAEEKQSTASSSLRKESTNFKVSYNKSEITEEASTSHDKSINCVDELHKESITKNVPLIENKKCVTSKDELTSQLYNDTSEVLNNTSAASEDAPSKILTSAAKEVSSSSEKEETNQLPVDNQKESINRIVTPTNDLWQHFCGNKATIKYCDYNQFHRLFYPLLQCVHGQVLTSYGNDNLQTICQDEETRQEENKPKLNKAVGMIENFLNSIDIIDFDFSKVIQKIQELEKCDYRYVMIGMMVLLPQMKNIYTSFGKLFYNSLVERCGMITRVNRTLYDQVLRMLNSYDPKMSTSLEILLKPNIKIEIKEEKGVESLVISDDEDGDCCIVSNSTNVSVKVEVKKIEKSPEPVQQKYVTPIPTVNLMSKNSTDGAGNLTDATSEATRETAPNDTVTSTQETTCNGISTESPGYDRGSSWQIPYNSTSTVRPDSTGVEQNEINQLRYPTYEQPTTTTTNPLSRLENMIRQPCDNIQYNTNTYPRPHQEISQQGECNYGLNMMFPGVSDCNTIPNNQSGRSPMRISPRFSPQQELSGNRQIRQNKQTENNAPHRKSPPQYPQEMMQYGSARPQYQQEPRSFAGHMNGNPSRFPQNPGGPVLCRASPPAPQHLGPGNYVPGFVPPIGQKPLEGIRQPFKQNIGSMDIRRFSQNVRLDQSGGNHISPETHQFLNQASRDAALRSQVGKPVESMQVRYFPQSSGYAPHGYWPAQNTKDKEQFAASPQDVARAADAIQNSQVTEFPRRQSSEDTRQFLVRQSADESRRGIGRPSGDNSRLLIAHEDILQRNGQKSAEGLRHILPQTANEESRQNIAQYAQGVGQHQLPSASQKNMVQPVMPDLTRVSQQNNVNYAHALAVSQNSLRVSPPNNTQYTQSIDQNLHRISQQINPQYVQHVRQNSLCSPQQNYPIGQHMPHVVSQQTNIQQTQQHSPLARQQCPLSTAQHSPLVYQQPVVSQRGKDTQKMEGPYVQRNNFSNGEMACGSSSDGSINGSPQTGNAAFQNPQVAPVVPQNTLHYMLNHSTQPNLPGQVPHMGYMGMARIGTSPPNVQNQFTIPIPTASQPISSDVGKKKRKYVKKQKKQGENGSGTAKCKTANRDNKGVQDKSPQLSMPRLNNDELMPAEVPHSISSAVPTNNISDRVTELHIPDSDEHVTQLMKNFNSGNTPESSRTINTIKELVLGDSPVPRNNDNTGGWWNQCNEKQLDHPFNNQGEGSVNCAQLSGMEKALNSSNEPEKKGKTRKGTLPMPYNPSDNGSPQLGDMSDIRPTSVVNIEHQGQLLASVYVRERPVTEIQRAVSSDSGCYVSPSVSPGLIEDVDVTNSDKTVDITKENNIPYLRDVECICGKLADLLCECKTAMYCSDACQQKDWNNHKEACETSRDPDFDDNLCLI